MESIQIQHVLHYMKEMERLGWKRNGVNIVALALRKFFEFYNMRGFQCLNEYLVPLPRKVMNIPRVANEKDFKKLLKAIPRDSNPNNIRNLALVTLIWDSWARSGEIISLDEGPWRSADQKVRAEWAFKSVGRSNPAVLTIYDYKDSSLVKQVTSWHIGAKGNLEAIRAFLEKKLGRNCFVEHRITLGNKDSVE